MLLCQNIEAYFDNRNSKYESQNARIEQKKAQNLHVLPYFQSWLSGFIEAKGCFRQDSGFIIAQNDDLYL